MELDIVIGSVPSVLGDGSEKLIGGEGAGQRPLVDRDRGSSLVRLEICVRWRGYRETF